MEILFCASFLVQYSLEPQKAKIAMAENKPQTSDYIQAERKAVLHGTLSCHIQTRVSRSGGRLFPGKT